MVALSFSIFMYRSEYHHRESDQRSSSQTIIRLVALSLSIKNHIFSKCIKMWHHSFQVTTKRRLKCNKLQFLIFQTTWFRQFQPKFGSTLIEAKTCQTKRKMIFADSKYIICLQEYSFRLKLKIKHWVCVWSFVFHCLMPHIL